MSYAREIGSWLNVLLPLITVVVIIARVVIHDYREFYG